MESVTAKLRDTIEKCFHA